MKENQQDVFTRRMFIKGMATSFGALPVFAWPRWAQAFYYNLGFFKKGAAASLYVEDVFSTYLYTGNTSVQAITNGIDLAGKGGLVWIKGKDSVRNHIFRDSARGLTNGLSSNLTDAQVNWVGMGSFNTTGFTLQDDGTPGTNTQSGNLNQSGVKFASWTFRKAAKFFDIVTYTGNGNAGGQTVAHSLGSDPGMVIIKRTDAVDMWIVHHRSQAGKYLQLESTAAATTFSWITTSSTNFVLANNGGAYNAAGGTYVAYLFAHDTAADGMIQCGSFTTDAGGNYTVSGLGWEPQCVWIKASSTTGNWVTVDSARGFVATANATNYLSQNLSNAESQLNLQPATGGFSGTGTASQTYIYLAIRRGPMKTPTSGTSVFSSVAYAGDGANPKDRIGIGFSPDLLINMNRTGAGDVPIFLDRLRGPDIYLHSSGTSADSAGAGFSFLQDGFRTTSIRNVNSNNYVSYCFRRAPGFFDQVCYTGTGSTSTYSHNLGVPPELMIIKSRNDVNDWGVYHSALGNTNNLRLNTTAASSSALNLWGSTTPTASVFTTNGTYNIVGGATITYVAYLFASCPGVSKVGSYTGNGGTGDSGLQQIINCGFTGGARFILIKRTDNVSDWFIWDTARGISAGNDPHLSLNTTAVEVTTDSSINYDASGFIVSQASATNINVTGATYIYMAIA